MASDEHAGRTAIFAPAAAIIASAWACVVRSGAAAWCSVAKRAKFIARWTGVALAIVSVAFAVVSYKTHWDWWLRDDLVEKLAERFDLSYSTDAASPSRPDDPEWVPLIRLIKQYSPHRDELPKDREPKVLARAQAITAAKTAVGEWTAPSTPVLLFYRKWPDPGSGEFKLGRDAFVVGTIGDLRDWVRRDRADFDFFWRTIIFGLLSACTGVALALADTISRDRSR